MAEPSSAATPKVNGLAIAALVVGVVSILFNPFVLVSVIAIVLGAIALVAENRSGKQRTYRLIAVLGIVAGVIGAILLMVSNTISALP